MDPDRQPDTPRSAESDATQSQDEGDSTDGDDRRSGAQTRARKKTLSDILTSIAEDRSRAYIAVNDLITLLGGRGRAALILIFALPNVLPAPPGVSGILGLPLVYLSFQMMLGRIPWLPRFIGERSVPRDRFAQMVERFAPWLARAERLLRPRWSWLVGHQSERLMGALCFILAIVLTLPIPFGNMLPALALCLISLGMLERDGVWVMLGALIGVSSLLLVTGVVYALVKSSIFLFLNAFA